MHSDQRKNHALEVLHQVVEHPQSLGVLALLDIQKRADLRAGETEVISTQPYLQLLAARSAIRWWPVLIILLEYLTILNNSLHLQ